jgi:hypothetical protein
MRNVGNHQDIGALGRPRHRSDIKMGLEEGVVDLINWLWTGCATSSLEICAVCIRTRSSLTNC